MTISCGTIAQAAGRQDRLGLYGSLPAGAVNQSYNAVLTVTGGSSPYSFSLKYGTLPPGIAFNTTTGAFYGKPTTRGVFAFEVIVSDVPSTSKAANPSPSPSRTGMETET